MNKNVKKELGRIIDGLTTLEVTMARSSLVSSLAQAEWVNTLSSLTSRLDKIWKGEIK